MFFSEGTGKTEFVGVSRLGEAMGVWVTEFGGRRLGGTAEDIAEKQKDEVEG